MITPNLDLADWIHDLRHRRGWSQRDLAQGVGVSKSTIHNWEHGYSAPDTDFLALLEAIARQTPPDPTDRADSALEIVADPAVDFVPCRRCPVRDQCQQDVLSSLPTWCESIDVSDLALAITDGQLDELQARYGDDVPLLLRLA